MDMRRHLRPWVNDAELKRRGGACDGVIGAVQEELVRNRFTGLRQLEPVILFRDGYATGGRAFGYEHVAVNGNKERRINETEAGVVRDIYQRYGDGEGFKQIAHALNDRSIRSPRPQRGRPAGWDQGTIRAVLRRPIYRGVLVYNKTKKRDVDGSRFRGRQKPKARDEWVTLDKPELRIVSPEISDRVDDRLSQRRNAYLRDAKGHLLGRPRGASDGKHLLAGFIQCACGATFEAVRGHYVCSARRRKGHSVCASEFSFSVQCIDRIFLDAIEGTLLQPAFIERILDDTFAVAPDVQREALLEEQARLTTESTNITKAIATGLDISALADALKARDSRLRAITAQLAKPVVMPDREVLRAALELRTGQWRNVLRGPHIAQARLILQHLIELPIKIMNEPTPPYIRKGSTRGLESDRRYVNGKWVAAARPEGLLVGLVQKLASPTGTDRGCGPDFRRILKAA